MKIGFAGLGQMGKPMAMNLNKAGIELIVYDVRTESYPAFSAKGIATAASLNDLADCEIVFLSLPDTHIVQVGKVVIKVRLWHMRWPNAL